MHVRPLDLVKDKAIVESWLAKRPKEQVDVDSSLFPPSGLMFYDDQHYISCVMWMTTNCDVLLVTDYITNPDTPSASREAVTPLVAMSLLRICRDAKIKRMIALTRKSAIEHFFKASGLPGIQLIGSFNVYRWDNPFT